MIRALAAAFCLLPAFPVHAQLNSLIPKAAAKPEATKPETADQTRERLQNELKAAKDSFAKLDDPTAEGQLPEGVSVAEFTDRRRNVQQTISSLERQLKTLAGLPGVAENAKKAAEALTTWAGFKETPPYSVLLVDDLRNQQDIAAEKQATASSTLQLFERNLEDSRNEAKLADETQRVAASKDLKDPAASWRLEAAGDTVRMLRARMASLDMLIAAQRDVLGEASSRLALVEKKLKQVMSRQDLTDEDMEKVRKSSAGRMDALRKELEDVRKRSTAALGVRRKLEDEGKAPDASELAKLKLEAAQTRVETLQYSADLLDALMQLESQLPEAFEKRRVLIKSDDAGQREEALVWLRGLDERLKTWGVFATNELSVSNAELRGQEARVSALPAGDPKIAPLNDRRTDLWERLNITQRLAQAVDLQQRQLTRWLGDFEHLQGTRSVGERFKDGTETAWRKVVKIWNSGVWNYDGPDGKPSTITLGKLIGALLLFIVGYWIASRITRRLQRYAVAHRRIGEAQSATLRRWLMVVLGFCLAVATLNILQIPLTVFAFLGGALAIGLGFGTQTLIKNFISGIIVLFERNIRVGDILDVGGTVGTVQEINTRSSVIRSGDGVDTLVPNSVFLENKVTNWTHTNRRVRRSIRIGVSYGSPVQRVAEILVECANRHGRVLKEPEPMALFEDFGDSALLFTLQFWVELGEKTNASLVSSDLRFMIEKRFSEAGIEIPFANRDVRIVTGEALKVEWSEGLPEGIPVSPPKED